MQEKTGIQITGWIKIFDPITNQVFVNKKNAIHYENFSISIAETMINQDSSWVDSMSFGNGGTTVSTDGVITYLTPNTVGTNAQLYNETYNKVVNGNSVLNHDPNRNNLEIRHVSGTTYTDFLVTCLLDYTEPDGQEASDTSNSHGNFVFDEIGLKSYSSIGDGRLLTHVMFHPVQKSLNRLIEIDYTVRINCLVPETALGSM